jgi:hypothetical protein
MHGMSAASTQSCLPMVTYSIWGMYMGVVLKEQPHHLYMAVQCGPTDGDVPVLQHQPRLVHR